MLRTTRSEKLTCNDLWRYVGQLFDKRLSKRDLMKLLRLDPKHVGARERREA